MTRPRRRKHHLVQTMPATRTLCNLPVYRRHFVLVSDRHHVDACDPCTLAAERLSKTARRRRGGNAGPTGGPGAGPAR